MGKWKKYLAVVLTLVMVTCCLPTMGSNVKAEGTSTEGVYNAATYFAANTEGSNTGVWQYESRTIVDGDYVYTSMNYDSNSAMWKSSDLNSNISTVTGDLVTSSSTGTVKVMQLQTYNQTMEPVLSYVAPKSGLISVSMANRAVFAPGTGTNTDRARFIVMHNEDILLEEEGLDESNNDAGNRVFTDAMTLSVNAGDTIRFIVGRNKMQALDYGVRFNPEITYVQEYDVSYNAYDDYSTASNPNGVWGYQYRVLNNGSYTYTDLGLSADSTAWIASGKCGIYKAQGDQVTSTTNNVLKMAPWDQTNQAVLNFTAPYSGTIEVSMTNGGVFAPHQSSDGVSFWFMKNEEVLLSKTDLDNGYNAVENRFFTEAETLTVAKGDVIRFVVGRNKAVDGNTYFNPQIEYTEVYDFYYNAYDDYSTAANPNGLWGYQYRVLNNGSYTYTDLGLSADSTAWIASGKCGIYKAQGDQVTSTTNNVLKMTPWDQTNQAVLNFTAPYSGTIEVSMTNGGVFAPHQSSDGVSFWFMKNEEVLLSKTDLDNGYNAVENRFFTETETLTVAKGDVIRFVVGRNKAVDGNTYFNPQIQYISLNNEPSGITYYVSSTDGNDTNAGIVSTAPWKTLAKLQNVSLGENDKVLLKAGDTFTEQWVLNKVQGTKGYPVVIGTYGDVETNGKPCINPEIEDDSATKTLEIAAPCIKLNNAEGLEIEGLKITGSGVGIHLNYDNTFNNEYIKIKNCEFANLTGFDIRDYRGTSERSGATLNEGVYKGGENITGVYQMATAITASVNNYNIGVDDPALIGLYIEQCTTDNCGTLYAPASSVYDTNEGGSKTINGMYVTGCTMKNNDYYGIYIDGSVQGGYLSDCTIDTCGDATEFAPGTAGILLSIEDYAILNTEIKNQQRGGNLYDGVAIDLEHLCNNVIVRNCYIHDNTGAGVLMYDSNAGSEHANTNCQIINNLFENNASSATGTLLYDDPFADIRMTSDEGYAANNCTISGNSYFNNIDNALLTYSFVSDNQKQSSDCQNTIENNTQLSEIKGSYLEDKETVLAIYSAEDMFGNYNKSSYKADVRMGVVEPFATVIKEIDFQFATTFSTNLSALKNLWTPLLYGNNVFTKMALNSESTKWEDGTGAIISATGMHPAVTGQTVLKFTAPQTGRICISMLEALTLTATNSDGTYITVLDHKLQTIAEPVLLKGGTSQVFTPVYVTVNQGEDIYICLSKCEGNSSDWTGIKPEISYVYNDVNSDAEAKLNVCDIVRMKKMISGEATKDTTVADYTGDTLVTDSDISVVRQYCVNWWDTYSE